MQYPPLETITFEGVLYVSLVQFTNFQARDRNWYLARVETCSGARNRSVVGICREVAEAHLWVPKLTPKGTLPPTGVQVGGFL